MKLSGMGVFLTMLYDDRFNIYRTDKRANEDSSTDIFYQETPKYADVPGRLSFSSDDTGSDTAVDETPISTTPSSSVLTMLTSELGTILYFADIQTMENSFTPTKVSRLSRPGILPIRRFLSE